MPTYKIDLHTRRAVVKPFYGCSLCGVCSNRGDEPRTLLQQIRSFPRKMEQTRSFKCIFFFSLTRPLCVTFVGCCLWVVDCLFSELPLVSIRWQLLYNVLPLLLSGIMGEEVFSKWGDHGIYISIPPTPPSEGFVSFGGRSRWSDFLWPPRGDGHYRWINVNLWQTEPRQGEKVTRLVCKTHVHP